MYVLKIKNKDWNFQKGEINFSFRPNGISLETVEQGEFLRDRNLIQEDLKQDVGNAEIILNGKKLSVSAEETYYEIVEKMDALHKDIRVYLQKNEEENEYNLIIKNLDTGEKGKIDIAFNGEGLEIFQVDEPD